MKKSYAFRPKLLLIAGATALGSLISPSVVHGQDTQTYIGGDGGTWDQGVTADWSGPSTWAGGFDYAFFNTPGTVNISGTVTADYLEFSQSGATTITGGTLEENPWLTWGANPSPGYETLVQVDGGAGPVTIASQIELSDLGGNEQDYMTNFSSSTLTIDNIDFGAYTLQPGRTSDRRVNLYSNSAAGSITMNGAYTDNNAYGDGELNFEASGAGSTALTASVFKITSSADFSHFTNGQLNNYGGGIFNINNSTFLSSESISATDADAFNEINIIGGQTINLHLYDSTKNSGTSDGEGVSDYGVEHINQSTADVSTWTGSVDQDGSNLNLSAVSGGRLIMSSNLYDIRRWAWW